MPERFKTVTVGKRKIGPSTPVYIIAEAGVNHNGDVKLAERMIKVAAESGADAVKFQAYRTDSLVSRGTPLAAYQKKALRAKRTQATMLRELELAPSALEKLKKSCEAAGIEFLASPFDLESLEFLLKLGVNAVKIASGQLTDTPLLERVAAGSAAALLSTGAATMREVKTAVGVLTSHKLRNVALFHCVSAYPAAYEDVNLRAIATLREAFSLPVGFSDHSVGIHMGSAAVAAGALLLEKHFTLDRKLPGPDQRLSLEPGELHSFVTAARQVEQALGDGVKRPVEAESDVIKFSRKSLVLTRAVKKGERLEAGIVTTKRPGTGIEPRYAGKVAGRRAKCDIPADTILTWDMV